MLRITQLIQEVHRPGLWQDTAAETTIRGPMRFLPISHLFVVTETVNPRRPSGVTAN